MSPQLDFFGILVSDMARSVAFYRRLGLEFPEGAEGEQLTLRRDARRTSEF